MIGKSQNKNIDQEAVMSKQQAQKGEKKEKDQDPPDLKGEGSPFGTAGTDSEAENQTEKNNGQAAQLTPEEKIAELEAQLADVRDQLLRKAADFENFRKRINQEKQGAIEYANQSLLLDIIPVIDDFERAIQAGESSLQAASQQAGSQQAGGLQADLSGFLDGVKMIEKRLSSQLESKWGLKRFLSAGEPFDPNLHEALMMERSPDVSEPVVQEDFFKGYFLKERVIRAAKVKVLMPALQDAREASLPAENNQ